MKMEKWTYHTREILKAHIKNTLPSYLFTGKYIYK